MKLFNRRKMGYANTPTPGCLPPEYIAAFRKRQDRQCELARLREEVEIAELMARLECREEGT